MYKKCNQLYTSLLLFHFFLLCHNNQVSLLRKACFLQLVSSVILVDSASLVNIYHGTSVNMSYCIFVNTFVLVFSFVNK